MKCPVCQAKLMPVDGQMFCLQCGTAVAAEAGDTEGGPVLEETSEPVLQRAIVDALEHAVTFRPPPAVLAGSAAGGGGASGVPVSGGGVTAVLPGVAGGPSAAVAETAPAPKVGAAALNLLPVRPRSWRWRRVGRVWPAVGWVVLGAGGLLAVANWGLGAYYAARVYPGVRVGTVDLSGVRFDRLAPALAVTRPLELTVQAGTVSETLDTASLGQLDVDALARQARAAGRTARWPLVGVAQTLTARPLALRWRLNEAVLVGVAADVTRAAASGPRDAVVVIVKGQVYVVPERVGARLETTQVAAAIREAYGGLKAAVVTSATVAPATRAAAYAGDAEEVRARLGLKLQLKLRSVVYAPTPTQIGGWLVVNGPGKGVTVDGARVAVYIAGLPGAFDRAAAVKAVREAVAAKRDLTYSLSIRRVTAVPTLAALPPISPPVYGYCARGGDGAEAAELRAAVARVLADPAGWTLGGQLGFVPAERDCNVTLELAAAATLKQLNAACTGQSVCVVGNRVVFDRAAWRGSAVEGASGGDSTASVSGSAAVSRVGLINDAIGRWLGFDHPL